MITGELAEILTTIKDTFNTMALTIDLTSKRIDILKTRIDNLNKQVTLLAEPREKDGVA